MSRPPLDTRWTATLEAELQAMRAATAADDWPRALEIATALQALLPEAARTPAAADLPAVRRARDAVHELAARVEAAREATASALRELHTGRKAVRAYR